MTSGQTFFCSLSLDTHHIISITNKVPYLVIWEHIDHKLDDYLQRKDRTPPVMNNQLSSWNLEITHEHIQHPKVGPSHTSWFKENPDHLMKGKHKTHLHVFKSAPSVQPSWLNTSTLCVNFSSNQNRRSLHKMFEHQLRLPSQHHREHYLIDFRYYWVLSLGQRNPDIHWDIYTLIPLPETVFHR